MLCLKKLVHILILYVVLILLGDFFFDARCINMADTIINSGMKLNIIDSGKSDNNYRGKRIHHISLPKRGFNKYLQYHQKVKNILITIIMNTKNKTLVF